MASSKGNYRAGDGTGPQVAAALTANKGKQAKEDAKTFGELLVKRRHEDWEANQIRWRWLLDSFEGGDRYRQAVYGGDRKGLPLRNLMRHLREYPDAQENPQAFQAFAGFVGGVGGTGGGTTGIGVGPWPGQVGADAYATAHDDDFELRRARTPTPAFVREAAEIHIGKIYDQEIDRDGPADLVEWWEDVDGCGTTADEWMEEVVAPLLRVLGNLDICFDHPKLPPGEKVNTQADVNRLGLDVCVASYILPENMVWWRTDSAGRYLECLVREYVDPSDRAVDGNNKPPDDPDDDTDIAQEWSRNYVRWRHWTTTGSTLYSNDGKEIIEPELKNSFGRPPIRRLMAGKKHRTRDIGQSEYETTAELQREYYNRDSELILSDILQAHPSLSGPEDFCKGDNTISIGPGNILPKKRNPEGHHYEGWEYVTPSKDPAESLRKNKEDIRDNVDRINGLTKPAGVQGTTGGSIGQSGISKQLDSVAGNKILCRAAKALAKAERFIAEYALMVLRNAPPDPEVVKTIKVGYPTTFELKAADEIIATTAGLQNAISMAGQLPTMESALIQQARRQVLIGLDDDMNKAMDTELELAMAQKAQIKEQTHELNADLIESQSDALAGQGSEEQAAGNDPVGISASTALGPQTPIVR